MGESVNESRGRPADTPDQFRLMLNLFLVLSDSLAVIQPDAVRVGSVVLVGMVLPVIEGAKAHIIP